MPNRLEALLTQPSWQEALKEEWSKTYMLELLSYLDEEVKQKKTILPPHQQWFAALNAVALEDVKVVILGQDPYPTVGHAHGLCFSVEEGVKLPKSLKNIYKELYSDCGVDNTHTGNLTSWASQGILLLNSVLTVEAGKANAHKDIGWEEFTDSIIETVNSECENVVFVLWGAYAQKKGKYIDTNKHLVLNDPHPSPLSAYRGFWGSKPFSKINTYLVSKNKLPIEWKIEASKSLFTGI